MYRIKIIAVISLVFCSFVIGGAFRDMVHFKYYSVSSFENLIWALISSIFLTLLISIWLIMEMGKEEQR